MHRAWAFGVLVLCAAAHAQQSTEIWRCVDAEGRRHYTNSKKESAGMKCELVTSQHVYVAPREARTPNFPRESAGQSLAARERQRQIQTKELAAEEQALEQARQALAQQEAVRSGDERNYARVLERLQPFKATVENHEKNIQALQRELANLK